MLTRLSLTARIGLALIIVPLAMVGASVGWYFTRSWEPLNVPISLARGHIRAEFDVNVASTYAIEVDMSYDRVLERHPSFRLAPIPWSVSQGKSRVAAGEGEAQAAGYWMPVGGLQCGKGHYVLDLDVREDQGGLDFYEPHLVVSESGGKANSDPSLWVGALSVCALLPGAPSADQ